MSHHFPGRPAATTGRCPSLHVDGGFAVVLKSLTVVSHLRPKTRGALTSRRGCVISAGAGFPFLPASRSSRAQKQSSPSPLSMSRRLCVASRMKKLLTTVDSCSVSNRLARKRRSGRRFHLPGKALSHFPCRSTSLPRPLPLDWTPFQRCHRRVHTIPLLAINFSLFTPPSAAAI